MAFKIVYRAGPYVVRMRKGRHPRAMIDTYTWVEGPGLPQDVPANSYEAARRNHTDNTTILADVLAAAYKAGTLADH